MLCDDPSFIRWIEGEAYQQEARQWNQWVRENEDNRKVALQAQQKILGMAFKDPVLPDVQAEWEKVHHDIKQKKTFSKRRKRGRHNYGSMALFLKVAAFLLVGVFMSVLAYKYGGDGFIENDLATHTTTTDYGQTKTITLSDGLQIILAPNSKLSYKENWLDKPVKQLSLEGEAFFAVTRKPTKEHPKLVVKTEDGTASVWGTRFAVDTYVEGTRVVLEEGEVEVQTMTDKKMTMKPGEMAAFQKESSKIELQQVNPRVYTSWTTNELFFDNTPLSVLVDRIERTYGVEVEVQDPEILTKKLSGSLGFKSLRGLTGAVAEIFDIQIEQSKGTLSINYNKNN